MPAGPPGIYYDGDFTVANAVGGLEDQPTFPFQPFTRIFRQKFQQFRFNPMTGAACFQPMPLSAQPADSGMTPAIQPFQGASGFWNGPFLVEETPRQDIGAGIVEWSRVWSHVPFDIYEFPALNYSRQNYAVTTIPWQGAWDRYGNFHGTYRTYTSLEEWPEPTTGIVVRRFRRCLDSWSPDLILAHAKPQLPFRIVKITDQRGTEQVFDFGTQGVAEPTSITRWMGEIREIRDVYVTPNIVLGQNFGKWLASAGFFSNMPPSGLQPQIIFDQGF